MPLRDILDKTSFGVLDDAGKSAVRALFDETYHDSKPLALDTRALFESRKLLPISFEFYSHKVGTTNPVAFQFMTPEQRDGLEGDLLYAFYILSAQYQLATELHLDEAEHRRENLRNYGEQIKLCADRIDQLRASKIPVDPVVIHLSVAAASSTQYLAYLGLTVIPPIIAKGINAIATGEPANIKEWMGEGPTVHIKDARQAINSPRLYWVWAGSWIGSWIDLLSDYYIQKQAAEHELSAIKPLTGFMSFSLYLMNASVEILMVAKHTIQGPWMNDSERKISAWERFKAHADLRKYAIINDFVWGLGNMACFYWLVGKGALGYYGNIATTGLLLMDATLSCFQYIEASIQHDEEIRRYERDEALIQAKFNGAATLKDMRDLETIQKAKAQCLFEWKYKTYRLIKDLSYAIALVLAFSVTCCFLLPATAMAASTALILSVGGTALCFLSALINDVMAGQIDKWKSQESASMAQQEVARLTQAIHDEPDPSLKKLLYLDMKQGQAICDHQTKLNSFETKGLLRDMFIKVFVPPLVFSSLIFLPLGLGVAAIVVGFALAVVLGKLYIGEKPGLSALPTFDQEEYDGFITTPHNLQLGGIAQ